MVEFGKNQMNIGLLSGKGGLTCQQLCFFLSFGHWHGRRGRKRQSHLLFWLKRWMIFVASPITTYLELFPHVIPWRSADWRTGRSFCPRVATKSMILMDLLTSIFPNHSSQDPWLRLSDTDYVCFLPQHVALGQKQNTLAEFHCVMCFWTRHAYLSLAEWRNLTSSLGFVYHPTPLSSPWGEPFFPGFLRQCFGGREGF